MKKLIALTLAILMMVIPMTAMAAVEETVYYPDYTEETEYVTNYVVVCRALNVRATASTAKSPVDLIHRGDVIKVIEVVDGWAKVVTTDGSDAYVYAKYIEAC